MVTAKELFEQPLRLRQRDRRARCQPRRPVVDERVELADGHDPVDEAERLGLLRRDDVGEEAPAPWPGACRSAAAATTSRRSRSVSPRRAKISENRASSDDDDEVAAEREVAPRSDGDPADLGDRRLGHAVQRQRDVADVAHDRELMPPLRRLRRPHPTGRPPSRSRRPPR